MTQKKKDDGMPHSKDFDQSASFLCGRVTLRLGDCQGNPKQSYAFLRKAVPLQITFFLPSPILQEPEMFLKLAPQDALFVSEGLLSARNGGRGLLA